MGSTAMLACNQCGAAVADMAKHVFWHRSVSNALAAAALTRDELDDLRDSIRDGELGPLRRPDQRPD